MVLHGSDAASNLTGFRQAESLLHFDAIFDRSAYSQALRVEGDLGWPGDRRCVVEESVAGFGLAFDFPDPGVGNVVGLLLKRSHESRAEPLNAIVGLRRKIAVVEGDDVGALVAAIPGLL